MRCRRFALNERTLTLTLLTALYGSGTRVRTNTILVLTLVVHTYWRTERCLRAHKIGITLQRGDAQFQISFTPKALDVSDLSVDRG
jgi:hypothetical protein